MLVGVCMVLFLARGVVSNAFQSVVEYGSGDSLDIAYMIYCKFSDEIL